MSWWDVGEDVTGDRPADILRAVLRNYAKFCQEQGISKPGLLNMLNAFARALSLCTNQVEESGDALGDLKICAILDAPEGSGRLESSMSAQQSHHPQENELAQRFAAAINDIAAVYIDSWQRKPRIRELLYALGFVLGYKPSRFLDMNDEQEINEIFARYE
jgi:hypothetical protein